MVPRGCADCHGGITSNLCLPTQVLQSGRVFVVLAGIVVIDRCASLQYESHLCCVRVVVCYVGVVAELLRGNP